MYAEDYGDRAMALDEHLRIGEPAAACLSCATQACAGGCPYGVPIPEFTLRVATNLA